jgi:hypothetical protein
LSLSDFWQLMWWCFHSLGFHYPNFVSHYMHNPTPKFILKIHKYLNFFHKLTTCLSSFFFLTKLIFSIKKKKLELGSDPGLVLAGGQFLGQVWRPSLIPLKLKKLKKKKTDNSETQNRHDTRNWTIRVWTCNWVVLRWTSNPVV